MSVRSWLERWTGNRAVAGATSLPPPAGVTAPLSSELVLLRTLPGRLFILCALLLVALRLLKPALPISEFLDIFHGVVSLALIGSGGWLAFLLLVRNRRKFLWRIRRKLILSYLCLGLVPATLIVAFALAGGAVLYNNVAAYLFHEGFDDVVNDVRHIAEIAAVEIDRDPMTASRVLESHRANQSARYPGLSLAVIHLKGASGSTIATTGAWQPLKPPSTLPKWVMDRAGFAGALAMSAVVPSEAQRKNGDSIPGILLIRVVVPTKDPEMSVVADLPLDERLAARMDAQAGIHPGSVVAVVVKDTLALPLVGAGTASDEPAVAPVSGAFRNSVAFLGFVDWETGQAGRASVSLVAPARFLYQRMVTAAQLAPGVTNPDYFMWVLVGLGVVFIIVQGAFLLAGAGLARMITYSVHELSIGTERVRQGDFTYRIRVDSEDQLGDLADSYNHMSAGMEHYLHVQRQKQRLDDELRIAREIQKSLLPVVLPQIAGLSIADLCEPAREVGGDYYDFFMLGPRQLGVIVADVSGKGTSAALYMAELKGLMLALSHTERSPRQLLVTVNHLLAEHLDNRSFITATYAVIDLDAMTLVCARAGHTPLIIASRHKTDVVTSDGMVLGLRLPRAEERFNSLLEEHTHQLAPGDVIVLYTDGITEAMDSDSELFGEAALARIVSDHTTLDAAGIRERVLREVRAFVGEAEPHDDMTMVLLKIEDCDAEEHAA